MATLYPCPYHEPVGATAALLPVILVQVPSGLAACRPFASGLTSAEQITDNAIRAYISYQQRDRGFSQMCRSLCQWLVVGSILDTMSNLGYGIVEVAIGIGVDLFLRGSVLSNPSRKKGTAYPIFDAAERQS